MSDVYRLTRAYIGLGSNMDDPMRHVTAAIADLAKLPQTFLATSSSLYRSQPLGPAGQPEYINAVATLDTALSANDLLRFLQGIEVLHGRVREGPRWGPRSLDLDLLLYGEQVIESEELTIPHPGLYEREFVLYPLYEVAPALELPGVGRLEDCLAQCPQRGLVRLEMAGESRLS